MGRPITYRLGFLETAGALRDLGYALPTWRWLRRLGWASVVLAIFLAPTGIATTAFGVGLFGAGFLILALLWAVPYLRAWLLRRGDPLMAGEQRVEFDESGIRSEAAGARGFLSWSDVTRVLQTRHFVLLFTSTRRAVSIPKRVLAAEGQLDRLLALAAERAGREAVPRPDPLAPVDVIGPERCSVTYRWTFRELYAASTAVSRYGPRRWPLLLFMIALVALIGGPTLYGEWRAGGVRALDWRFALLAVTPLLIFLLARPAAGLWYAWSQTRSSGIARQEQRLSIGEDGVSGAGSTSATGIRWEAIVKVVETRAYFLFFPSRYRGLVLPKRLLAANAVTDLRAFLDAKLGARFTTRVRPAR